MLEFTTYQQFWNYVLDNYDEERQLTIENLISYYINKNNGFGDHNCELTYAEYIKFDTTGELNELALIGTKLEQELLNKRKEKYRNNKK